MNMPCAVTRDLDAYQGWVDHEADLDHAAERLAGYWQRAIEHACPDLPESYLYALREMLDSAAWEVVRQPKERDYAN